MPERDSNDPERRGEQAPAPGRVLGLDPGQSRIGVAISDDARRVAVPFGTVHTGAPEDVKAIARIVAENDVTEVVVGLPLGLSGKSGEGADHARKFAEALRGFLGIPVALEDERLSTVEAERGLRSAVVGGRRRRAVVDQSAAAIILQSYLDRHRR